MKREKRLSFQLLFLLITAVATLPALGIIILSGWNHAIEKEQWMRDSSCRQVESLAMTQQTSTDSVRQLLNTLSVQPVFQENDHLAQSQILQKILSANPEYNNFAFTDNSGIVCASSRLSSGIDFSCSIHVQAALSGKGFTAGEFILTKTDQEPAFSYAQTVYNKNGEIIGALTAAYRLSNYRDLFLRLNLPPESMISILDHKGIRLFYFPDNRTNHIGQKIKEQAWKVFSENGCQGNLHTTGSDGITRTYTYKKLYLPSGDKAYMVIVIGIPDDAIKRPAMLILYRNTALITAVTALSILIAGILSHFAVGRNLKILEYTVSDIKRGNLSVRTGINKGTREITAVARALDNMAQTLETRNNERDETEQKLNAALSEREILLKEVHHRVKNNLQIITSILHLEQNNTTDLEEFARQLENRILAISSVHEMMYLANSFSTVEMEQFLPRLVGMTGGFFPGLRVIHHIEPMALSIDKAVPLALMVNELITNAVKYAGNPEGVITVNLSLTPEEGESLLCIQDDGPGFPENFQKEGQQSLGMILVQPLTQQLRGHFSADNTPGCRVRIWFSE